LPELETEEITELEEEIKKVDRTIKEVDEVIQDEFETDFELDDSDNPAVQLQKELDKELEEIEIKKELKEKEQKEEKIEIDQSLPLHEKIWIKFKHWLGWFFK